MTKPPDLRSRLQELVDKYGCVSHGDKPDQAREDLLAKVALPPVRRRMSPPSFLAPLAPPLRHGIDYVGGPRAVMPAYVCEKCGGGIFEQDEHERDPGACEREKVRQVMES